VMVEQRRTVKDADLTKIAEEVESEVPKMEKVLFDLVNINEDVLFQMTEMRDQKDVARTLGTIHVEDVVFPYIYLFAEQGDIYEIGLYLHRARTASLPVIEDKEGHKYIQYESIYYPVDRGNIETSLLLIMNANTPLLEKTAELMNIPSTEILEYIARSMKEARSFYASLPQLVSGSSYDFLYADGYKSFVKYKDLSGEVTISFEYYDIDSSRWSYYGINELYFKDIKLFGKYLARSKVAKDALISLHDFIDGIELRISGAYIFSNILKNILP